MINESFIIADLQIHSKYARATSKDLSIDNLEKWGRVKGLGLMGVGDFQHPLHRKEIDEKLTEDDKGILRTVNGFPFLWQTEVSLMFSQGGKRRAVHLLVFASNREIADKITSYLGSKGRLDYDGRPIFGITCRDLVKDLKEIEDKIEIIPAHAFTPWFGLYGSDSGFDSLKECFQDQTDKIYAIESGMSADPSMAWRLGEIGEGNVNVVSFSDAHCVHPDTFITLENGYTVPISEIKDEGIVAYADFKDMSYKNGVKAQYSKILSPNMLKEIKYAGGEIKVSDKHRFYVWEKGVIIEKFASHLKKGDLLIRSAYISHNDEGSILMKKPDINIYFSLSRDGLSFLRSKRNKRKLTQKQLADFLGIDKNHYWKIEKGVVKINDKILKKIVEILSLDYNLFTGNYCKHMGPMVSFPNYSSIKLFELLGYFIGDGCMTKINRGKCLILTDKNKDILRYYQDVIKNLFSCSSRLFKYSQQHSYGLVIPSAIAKFFELNFPESVFRSKIRRIPRSIFSAPLNEISGFLRGFFDAEGSLDDHGVKGCSANKLLLYQIDSLLKKFEIFSSVYLNLLEKKKQKYRHNLILYGENLRKFREKIGFNHNIKRNKLNKYVNNLKVFRMSKVKRVGDFILAEVKSVNNVKSDVDYLYDISVPGYKNYLANQLVVHNSFWPWRIGREATIFELKELSYENIMKAIRTGQGLKATIETPPEYGKYHYDGHRNCNFSCSPEETKKLNGLCPICKKPLTIGVDNRVDKIAKFPLGHKPINAKPFYKLLPLHELIALHFGVDMNSVSVWKRYNSLIQNFGNEFNILLNVPETDFIKNNVDAKLIDLILKNREGKIRVKPGFDGKYGQALLGEKQATL